MLNRLVLKIAALFTLIMVTLPCWAIDGFILQTTDYSFRQKWGCSSSPSVSYIPVSDTVFHEQTLYISVVVSDYQINAKKKADVGFSLEVFSPDNSLYMQLTDLPVLKEKLQSSSPYLSRHVVNLAFPKESSCGKYRIKVVVKDNMANVSKKLESEVFLTTLPSYDVTSFDEQSMIEWMDRYHLDPHPEQALACFLYASQSGMIDFVESSLPFLSMMMEIYRHNTFLYPQLLDYDAYKNNDTQQYLLILIHRLGLGDADFRSSLDTAGQEVMASFDSIPDIDIYGDVYSPIVFDMLWGTFMASGSYQPVLRLIQLLDYAKYKNVLEKIKDWENVSEKDAALAVKYLCYQSLVWSLSSNCEQHPLVRQYCEWALQHEKLSKLQRSELQKILQR